MEKTNKKPHDIVTLSFSEVFFQVEGQANDVVVVDDYRKLFCGYFLKFF